MMSVLFLLLVRLCLCVVPGDTWPGFLGGEATLSTSESIPTKWSPSEGVLWKSTPVGHGQSSPVLWDSKVFVTSTDGPLKDDYYIYCLSLSDGAQLWKHTFKNSDPVENSLYVSRAAPTPIVDSKRVIAFFESGDIVCLDHAGKQQWSRSIAKDYGKFQNKFGLCGSPVQTDNHVIILVDDEGPSYLVAIDKTTGEEVWKRDRTSRRSWSSPSIQTIAGVKQVLVSSSGSVDGYDCITGNLLWSFADIGGNTGTTPLPAGPNRFFVAASGGREGENTELAKKSNLVMEVKLDGGKWSALPLWIASEAAPSWASPMSYRGCAYWVNRTGVIYCFDLETGSLNYKERTKQSCWATPIGLGDRIYFFGKDGLTTVIAAGKEFKILAENQLWDPDAVAADAKTGANESTEERRRAAAMFSGPTQYGCAVGSGKLIIRTGDSVYCIGKP